MAIIQPTPNQEPSAQCLHCQSRVDGSDRFCRHCGRPLSAKPQTGRVPWHYQPLWMLVLGLFVLGPFVLPLIWKSPAVSRTTRIWLTVGILAYTLLLAYWTWLLIAAVQQAVNQVMDQLEMM